MLRPDQIEFRKTGIGGSDAAAVLGISPFNSPLELWLEKTGRKGSGSNDSTRLRAGSHMESFVCAELAVRAGLSGTAIKGHGAAEEYEGKGVWVEPGVDSFRCPTHPFMLGNTDGRLADNGILEVKTSDEFPFLRKWGRGVPLYVQAQCQHYMACLGAQYTIVACIQGFHTIHLWQLNRDDDFIDNKLIPAEQEFWNWVETDTQPPADDSYSSERALKILYPEPEPKKVITLGDREHALAEQYVAAKESIRDIKDRERGFKNYLQEAMGDAEVGTLTNGVELHRVKSGRGWTFKMREQRDA